MFIFQIMCKMQGRAEEIYFTPTKLLKEIVSFFIVNVGLNIIS